MAKKDKTGISYELVIADALERHGFTEFQTLSEATKQQAKFYVNPSPRVKIQIPGTYIQADIIVGFAGKITHVFYITHWSNSRSSQYKFWRTFEEMCQQKVILDNVIAVNCVFEALPETMVPVCVSDSDELPADKGRKNKVVPIQLHGWAAANGWLMVDAFDAALLFPIGYRPEGLEKKLVGKALLTRKKMGFEGLWAELHAVRKKGIVNNKKEGGYAVSSRYRIGFLHLFILFRAFGHFFSKQPKPKFLLELSEALAVMHQPSTFASKYRLEKVSLDRMLMAISGIPVRYGLKRSMLCNLKSISCGKNVVRQVVWNPDFRAFLSDVLMYADLKKIDVVATKSFESFAQEWCIGEMVEDLCDLSVVETKAHFVIKHMANLLKNEDELDDAIHKIMANQYEPSRSVSIHKQAWPLEMLLYLYGLKSTEDIQARFKKEFQSSGFQIRDYAPYGDSAKAVSYIFQGRDVCEQWGSAASRNGLSREEFRQKCATSVANAIIGMAVGKKPNSVGGVVQSYLDNKSLRIISSNLNGFFVMIDYFLGDLAEFRFDKESSNKGMTQQSCWTDVAKIRWRANALATQCEGRSLDGRWIIKIQSAQDGNEKHKVKELAGRGRALMVKGTWEKKAGYEFTRRDSVNRALILDGDWSSEKIINLWESGWDWVGDVNCLEKLRLLMSER